ncbi:MAG TPA: EamA family transporter, partial [Thermoanaerobaculia bacterium]
MTRLVPNLALLVAAALWGATFTLVKASVATLSAEAFLFWRFLLAALILIAIAGLARAFTRDAMRYGLLLGLFLLAGFWLQTRGLVITTPTRSAFLTSVAVILVPLIDFAVYRTRVATPALVAAFLALAGVGIMVGGFGGSLNL